jgi:hypothetical protein
MAEQLIDAIMRGQQFRTRQREEAEASEDRGVLKELLALRLKAIKVEEKMKARELAKERLMALSGMRQNEAPDSALEPLTDQQLQGDQSPGMIATMPQTITPAQRRMKPIQVPGVSELGDEGYEQTPKTMEQMLMDIAQKKQAETMGTAYTLGAGGRRMLGNQILAENPRTFAPPTPQGVDINLPGGGIRRDFVTPTPGMSIDRGTPADNRAPVRLTDRDEQGWETDRFVPPSQVTTAPPPRRAPTPTKPNQDPLGEAANAAGLALDDLEIALGSGKKTRKEGALDIPLLGGAPIDPEAAEAENAAITNAQTALHAYFVRSGMASGDAEQAAAAALGIDENGAVTVAPGDLKARIPSLKKRLGYTRQAAAANTGGSKQVVPEIEGMVFRDGQWYVKQ